MLKNIQIIFLLLSLVINIYSQSKEDFYQKGSETIDIAKKAIFKEVQLKDITSIYLKRQVSSVSESTFVIQVQGKPSSKIRTVKSVGEEKVSILLPDKINLQYSSENSNYNASLPAKVTTVKTRMVTNGKNAKQTTEIFRDGKLINPESYNRPIVLPKAIKTETEKIDANKPTDIFDKEDIQNDVWDKVFPIFLNDLFKSVYKFKYIGKAVSPDTKANIINLELPDRKVTLYFDEKTNLLLQIEINLQTTEFTEVKNYYFSNYQIQDGILVAKKINIETITSKKAEDVKDESDYVVKEFKTKTNEEIIIKEFKINYAFLPKEFEVN